MILFFLSVLSLSVTVALLTISVVLFVNDALFFTAVPLINDILLAGTVFVVKVKQEGKLTGDSEIESICLLFWS